MAQICSIRSTRAASACGLWTGLPASSHIGRERGWGPISRSSFDASRSPDGALYIGDPAVVADKIVSTAQQLGLERFMLHISVGTLPHEKVLHAIELLGTEVAPLVRAAMSDRT